MFPIWLLGVLLAVTASVISNLGLNLQKRAHMNMEARKAKEREEKLERLGLTGAGSGRNRTSSMSTSAGAHVSFSAGDSATPTGADKPVSPTGILKGRTTRASKHDRNNSGTGGGTAKGEYHLMDTSPELEDAQVARDEERRQGAAAATTATTSGLPVSAPLNITPPPADSPHFQPPSAKSYTSLHELAQGGIDLDNFGVKKPSSQKKQNGSSNGQKKNGYAMVAAGGGINGSNGRARSSSAAGYHSQSRHSSSSSSRNSSSRSSRRRGSAMEGGSGAAAEGAGGEREHKKKKESYTKQPLWVVGLCCVIGGSLFDFAALAFVDQAVVAPLGSLTLVSNVFFSPCLLKEKVNRKQLYCTFLIIAGSCLAVAFAPHSNATPDIEAMFANFARMRFIAYAVLVVSSIIFLRLACYRLNKLRRNDPNGAYVRLARYHTFCYAAMAGIMGAQSVLFAKCTAMLLAASIAGDGLMFVYWGTYFVLLGLGVTIFLQIRWLNSGLRMFSALLIVPIFQSFWITVSVIAGMIFFGEYAGVFGSYVNGFLFPFGLILTVCGVYFLTRIATPGMAEAEAAAHRKKSRASGSSSTGSNVRRLSTSASNNAHSIIVPSPAHAAHASVAINGADGEPLPVGTSSSPLLQPQVGYGVPQSPRDPTPLNGSRRARPPPLNNAAGAAGAKNNNRESLDRSVDVGSYDKESDEYLHPPSRVQGDEETGDGLSGSEGEDPESDSSDDSSDAQSSAPYDKTYVMHSMAPLNFPAQFLMKYLPSALVADEPDTPRAYFEENSSGFSAPGEISLGGLPYANIFRVREEEQSGAAAAGNAADYSYDHEEEAAPPVMESSVTLAANNANAKRANANGNSNGGIQTIQVQPAPVAPLSPARQKKSSSASPSPNYSPRHAGGGGEGASHASTLSALSAMSPPSAFVGSADFSAGAGSSAGSQQAAASSTVIDLSSIEAAPQSFSSTGANSELASSQPSTAPSESGALLSAASAAPADFGAVDDSSFAADSAAAAALNNSGGGGSSAADNKKQRNNNKKNRKKGAAGQQGQLDESLL